MQNFFETLLRCSVAMSFISLFYMMITSLLSKRYSAKWLYYIWLVIVIGWAVPFKPHFNVSPIPYQIPEIQAIQAKYISVTEPIKIITNGMSRNSLISLWWVIAIIWIMGMLGIIVYNVWRHGRFLKLVNRWGEDIQNQGLLNILDNLRIEMKIRTHVGLKTCPTIASPMIIGFFNPIILLPSVEIATDELAFILRHELIHLKRKELWYKVLVLLATAVHWFNPVVYKMAEVIAVQCEISCDELLVHKTGLEHRKQYSETLIGAVRNGAKFQTALSTDFYSGGKAIITRIFHIMDTTKKKTGISVLCVAIMLIIGSKITFASSLPNNANYNIMQSEIGAIDSSKNKQIISVDVRNLERGKYKCNEGTYTIEGGDIIEYDLTTEGDNESLMIGFLPVDKKTSNVKNPLQMLTITDKGIENPNNQVKITQPQSGRYWLIIRNNGEEEQMSVKGTIKIIKGE